MFGLWRDRPEGALDWQQALRGEAVALNWLDQQQNPQISMINSVHTWLEVFPRLVLDDAVSRETVKLRQRCGLTVPDAIILATARCRGLTLATRNSRYSPMTQRGVLHPFRL
jgi:predicted nucleic acid-binding protein